MLTASARALWPFFVRFSAPSAAWIARARRRRARAVDSAQINLPHHHIAVYIYTRYWAVRLISGAWLKAQGK